MSLFPLLIIFFSAFIHAIWNYFAKRSKGGFAFVWLYMGVSVMFLTPFVIGLVIIQDISMGWIEFGFILFSAIIHMAYSLMLQKGYRAGDLSIIYPIARGTAPILVAISAIFIYGEKLNLNIIVGIILITISVFILTGGVRLFKKSESNIGFIYGLIIGLVIASYTLLDKGAVSIYSISPLILIYGSTFGQFIFLTLYIMSHKKLVVYEWNTHKTEVIGVGILQPLAYILVLFVMIFYPVSQIAPLREISILIGILMGSFLLSEILGKQRIIAGVIMLIGVMFIAF